MTKSMMDYLSTSASLTWIAQEVSKLDPQDGLNRWCIFCHNPIGPSAPVEAHDERCCWRISREFIMREEQRGV